MSNPLRLGAAACLLPLLALAADHPAVKLGLWEISHESQPGAQPVLPPEVLAKLPPEARARLEGSQHSRETGGHTTKQCVTQASLDHLFQDDEHTKACTHTIVAQTATSMEMQMECKNMGPTAASSTGTFKWTLATPETMQGSLELTTVAGSHTMSHHLDIKGKWLGADCGDVKPQTPRG